MKNLSFITIYFLFINFMVGQENFTIPEITQDQKQEVLYNHAISYFVTGISFAKTKGVEPMEYGKYIGKQFLPFWDKNIGFVAFVNKMIFISSQKE